jgi:hypothetical protein
MNWKKFSITFVVLYILGGILNYIVHNVLLSDTYQAITGIWRTDMDKYMWVQMVTALFLTFFFIYIFAKGREGKGWMEGLRYGLVIWAFLAIPSIYGQFMVYPLPYSLILKWLFADLVIMIIYGITVSFLYNPEEKKNKETA